MEKRDEICTVRIDLTESDPPIWREVEIPTAFTFRDLHDVIQAVMNWENYHLWMFMVGEQRFGVPSGEDFGPTPLLDATKMPLFKLLKAGGITFRYVYDFGDDWHHRITVTDLRAARPRTVYPRLTGGERNGPPEDCGGIPGFYDKIAVLTDPNADDPDDIREWLDGYDPALFDKTRIKADLRRIARRHTAREMKAP